MHLWASLLENGPPLNNFQPIMLVGWQQIWIWIVELMQMDVVTIVSCNAH
jgi:hypothetical protein